MTQILESLIEKNPWWKNESFRVEYKYRDLYGQIKKFMSYKQMISVTGLRRVGKTRILEKIIEDYLTSGFEPRNIMYFPFDEFRNVELREVLSVYQDMYHNDLHQGKYIVLFDEIQKVKDWENQLKSIYDTYSDNLKIVISGSESLFIKKLSKETLSGRIFEFKLEPLYFMEYILFKDKKYEPLELYSRELRLLFDDFTKCMGFPELVDIKEKDAIKKYVNEGVIEKVIYRDIPELLPIKDVAVLASVYKIIADEPGQLVELQNLANDLNISRQTLSAYLTYLEDAFLVRKLYNYSRNARKVERSLKKYYPTVSSVDMAFSNDINSKSKLFESLIVNQLRAEFFWRDSQKHEVDIILPRKQPIPIEIKYGEVNFDGLKAFSTKFKTKNRYIISYNKEISGMYSEVIPAFKALTSKIFVEENNLS